MKQTDGRLKTSNGICGTEFTGDAMDGTVASQWRDGCGLPHERPLSFTHGPRFSSSDSSVVLLCYPWVIHPPSAVLRDFLV